MNSISFFCDLAEATTPLGHLWEQTVGSDHAPVALRADWQSQLRKCHEELAFQYVRLAHNAPLSLHCRRSAPRRFPRRLGDD